MNALIDGILNYSTIYQAVMITIIRHIIQVLYIPVHINITVNKTLSNIKGDKFRLSNYFRI
jgi:hypothetical protein